MGSNLGTQPVNNGERIRMEKVIGMIIATLGSMIGGSSNNVENDKIHKAIEEIRKNETKGNISNLEKKVLQSYKQGKVKAQKGPRGKKAEMKVQDISKIKPRTKTQPQRAEKEREER